MMVVIRTSELKSESSLTKNEYDRQLSSKRTRIKLNNWELIALPKYSNSSVVAAVNNRIVEFDWPNCWISNYSTKKGLVYKIILVIKMDILTIKYFSCSLISTIINIHMAKYITIVQIILEFSYIIQLTVLRLNI